MKPCSTCSDGFKPVPATNMLPSGDEREAHFCAECFERLECSAHKCHGKGLPDAICYQCGAAVHDDCCYYRADDGAPLCGWECAREYDRQKSLAVIDDVLWNF